MKVAYLFYYQGKVESGATGHLEPKHVEPCVNSLLRDFDRIIIRDDGSKTPLPQAIKNPKTIYLRVEKRQGLQTAYRWAASDCLPQDLVMLVDPHIIYNGALLGSQLKAFDDDLKLQVLFQDVTAFRVRVGEWAAWRSEMNGPIGAEDGIWSVILRGSALKRYKAEWSDKLDPQDQSYPMPHLQTWCAKFLEKDEYRVATGPMIGVRERHVHDDTLDFWGQLRSCYTNGFKVGQTTGRDVTSLRQVMYELARGVELSQKWLAAEQLMSELGMAAAKFGIDENRNYWDTYWAAEDVDYMFLGERKYYLRAANYVIGNVLDVGCGNGLFLNCLWNQRPHYHFEEKEYDHFSGDLVKGQQLWFPFADGIDTCRVAIEKAKSYHRFNPNRAIDFNVKDFFDLRVQEDTYDTVLMLDFLPYIPWQKREEAVDLAITLTRHRIIATLPATKLPIPNILKDEKGRTWWTREMIADLFHGFPEPLTIDVAEGQKGGAFDEGEVTKWLVVADKRPVEDDWQPKYGTLKRLQELAGPQPAGADG